MIEHPLLEVFPKAITDRLQSNELER